VYNNEMVWLTKRVIKFTSKKLIGLPLADDPLKVSKKLNHLNAKGGNSVPNENGLAYKKD
jgi:hypothetical protein